MSNDNKTDNSECPLCMQTYRTEYLDIHMKRVHPPDYETVVCKLCKKSYKTKNHLQEHIRRIHNPLNKRRKYTRRKYKRKIEEEKCLPCGKIFTNKHYLQNHILRIHNKTKNERFVCDYCEKTFTYKELIQKHIMNVHCEKMIKCEYCSKQYKSSYLNEHKRRVHPIGDSLECHICLKKYKTKRLLRVHIQITHKIKYPKSVPNARKRSLKLEEKGEKDIKKTLLPKENVSAVKKVGYQCSHCNHIFEQRFQLLSHLRMLLNKEIFEELEFDDPEETPPCGTESSQPVIDCNKEDSIKSAMNAAEIKSEPSEDAMFIDADDFLFEIKQEVKAENDLEIGPVILQRRDFHIM